MLCLVAFICCTKVEMLCCVLAALLCPSFVLPLSGLVVLCIPNRSLDKEFGTHLDFLGIYNLSVSVESIQFFSITWRWFSHCDVLGCGWCCPLPLSRWGAFLFAVVGVVSSHALSFVWFSKYSHSLVGFFDLVRLSVSEFFVEDGSGFHQ